MNDKESEYAHLMNLLSDGRRTSTALLAGVVRDAINWSSLERDALVIDVRAIILASILDSFKTAEIYGRTAADISLEARLMQPVFLGIGRVIPSSPFRSFLSG
jgi:hypothetical protein